MFFYFIYLIKSKDYYIMNILENSMRGIKMRKEIKFETLPGGRV